ncbi:hypothetical protein NQD34_004343 [Periophthalmus magnuspinnatus]|nr:hypothetical protein NQD34_004343 [Periophthalmus magnuspinnatus]
MNATWRLLTLLSVVSCAEPRCSPTSYYKNCWIRRFPGIYIDVEESLRRGAQLLKFYQEDTALKCSRTCCLTRNFSCNLAIFHYDATQESVNCFHLHCPTLESCILSHRGNVVLYNITKGVDPDLLVFGKYFNTNVRVLPHHYIRSNASDPLPPDKRQFIHPRPRPVPPAPAPQPSSADASKTSLTTEPPNHSTTTNTPAISSSDAPANIESSKHKTNDTKGNLGRNHTTVGTDGHVSAGGVGGDQWGEQGPGWHVATHTVLVAVAICVTVLLGCCCSVVLVFSWRGHRKRMGRYRTAWRGKKGSMRLIKYVLVKENS